MKTDYPTIQVEVADGIAVFRMDNPPVNQLSEHFVRELADALAEAFRDGAVKAVVLTGTGKNFIAGADITQIKDIRSRDQILELLRDNNRFLNAIETGPKPKIFPRPVLQTESGIHQGAGKTPEFQVHGIDFRHQIQFREQQKIAPQRQ